MRYLTLLILSLTLAAAPIAQSWEEGPSLTVPRRDAAVAVLDGEIYVIGGQDAAGQPIGSVERLGATEIWESVASLREERYGAAAVVYQGEIVLMGGRDDSNEATDDVEAYDPDDNDWNSFDSLKRERQGHGAAVLGGRIYAVGGATDGGALLTNCEAYDDGQWYPFEFWNLDSGRAAFGLTVEDNVAYYAGGFGEFGPISSVRKYTLGNGTEILPEMPTARGGLALVSDGEAIYAIGGLDAESQALDVVERYDLVSGVWETIAPLNTARTGAVAAYLDGMIYVFGGRDDLGSILTSVEVLPLRPVATEESGPAHRLTLDAPYPNPFGVETTFTLRLDVAAPVTLQIYDVRGRVVATLADRRFESGEHRLVWDGTGVDGQRVTNGLYVARMVSPAASLARSVTLLR